MARFNLERTREFEVATPLQLKTHISDGRVRIQGRDSTTAAIAVRLQVRAESREEAERQADRVAAGIVCTGDALTIESADAGFWRRGNVRVEYDVLVPRQTRAELQQANGPLHVNDLAGPLEVRLDNGPTSIEGIADAASIHIVNGPTDVKDCGSSVDINVVNGPLRVRNAKGPVSLDLTNGPIYVEDVDLGFRASVLNGILTYRGPVGGDFDLTANNGSLVLHLPAGSRFELDAEAERGGVESDFRVDEGAPAPDGAHRLRLRAVQGNIRLSEMRRPAFAFA
jgi:DUF4097 and DUF4098 domain-containing protein YvlB